MTKATAQMGGLTRDDVEAVLGEGMCKVRCSEPCLCSRVRDLALQAIDRDGIDRGELARALLQKFNKLGHMETASRIVDFVLDRSAE